MAAAKIVAIYTADEFNAKCREIKRLKGQVKRRDKAINDLKDLEEERQVKWAREVVRVKDRDHQLNIKQDRIDELLNQRDSNASALKAFLEELRESYGMQKNDRYLNRVALEGLDEALAGISNTVDGKNSEINKLHNQMIRQGNKHERAYRELSEEFERFRQSTAVVVGGYVVPEPSAWEAPTTSPCEDLESLRSEMGL